MSAPLSRSDKSPFARLRQLVFDKAASVPEVERLGEALRASETRYRRLFEGARDGILILDADTGDIAAANPFLTELLGYTAQEIIGRKLWDIGPFKDVAASRIAFQELQTNEYIRYDDLPLQTHDGRSIAVEFVSNVYLANGKKVIQCNIRDITGRKHTEARLGLQSAALEAAANAIAITDRAGSIEWVNPAFCDLTGYTAEEVAGKNLRDLVKSGQHDTAFYRQLWETISSGQVWQGEIINRRKNGSLYTEEQTITPVRDANGEIRHFVAVKQDITERRRATDETVARGQLAALRASIGLSLAKADSIDHALQQCARALVANLGVALARIWTLDVHERALELRASAGLYTHLDGPHSRVPLGHFTIGRIAQDRTPHLTNTVIGDPHVHDQDWAHREAMVAFAGFPLIVNDQVVGVMALFARYPWPEAIMTSLASVADQVALGIQRYQMTDALTSAEERMRFALENAKVGIWELDYATGAFHVSPICESHLGVPVGTFGETVDALVECVHPMDRDAMRHTVAAASRVGGDFSAQYRALWSDGTVRWLRAIGHVYLDASGAPARAAGISLDISEHTQLEAQYQQAQKMEAVGRLAAGIAHDFNNLLASILGYCELLLPDFREEDPHRADLEEIYKASIRAAGLTRQLLAFSRREIIEPTVLDLSAIVSDMRVMLGRLLGDNLKIRMDLDSTPARIKADRGQMEQIVMNLAVNARDAMPTGGTLTIGTANVRLDEEYAATHVGVTPGSYVALSMTDTGTGMTPQVRARLFEPFFTTKEIGKGTGLGLATVDGIAKRNGGSVAVYSEPGKGASFHVYFPRAESAVMQPDVSPVVQPRDGGETVLVVEDAEELRDLARRLLQRQGYTVLIAANADEALRLFDEHPSIDLLLTDVVMPGTSGPELAKQLVEQRPGLKVIYMSGYTEDAIVEHGVLKPGIAFLYKPFTFDALAHKIREVLVR